MNPPPPLEIRRGGGGGLGGLEKLEVAYES